MSDTSRPADATASRSRSTRPQPLCSPQSKAVVAGHNPKPGAIFRPDAATAKALVGLLNELLSLDPAAATAFAMTRVPCNQAVADHPAIVVDELKGHPGVFTVGIVGLLNGLFPGDGPRIAVTMDEGPLSLENPPIGFEVVNASSGVVTREDPADEQPDRG